MNDSGDSLFLDPEECNSAKRIKRKSMPEFSQRRISDSSDEDYDSDTSEKDFNE